MQLHPTEIDLGLDRIRQVATRMQLLQPAKKVITVAGTNGKGSSVAMLSAIYQAVGYRVGTYTSPHLLHFNERIQLGGQPVKDAQIVEAFAAIEQVRAKLAVKLTYFEFATLAALFVFQQSALDLAILEVGLGGRLDAVNIVDADVALITAIDVDHAEWLGHDRAQIALEKAGILRSDQWAVCSDPQPPHTLQPFAESLGVQWWQLGRDFQWKALNSAQNSVSSHTGLGILDKKSGVAQDGVWDFVWNPSALRVKSSEGLSLQDLKNLPRPALVGDFQLQNAAGVLAAIAGLQAVLPVTISQIKQGLKQVQHQGRLQWLRVSAPHSKNVESSAPLIQDWLLDVAHNPQSAQALADYLQKEGWVFQQAVFSVLADKEALPMVQALKPFIQTWHLAPLNQPRAQSLPVMQSVLQQAGISKSQVVVHDTIEQAVSVCLKVEAQSSLAWGSFLTVSEALSVLNEYVLPQKNTEPHNTMSVSGDGRRT